MRTVSSSFWRNRRVLITGHTGFKGSWLAVWLNLLGAQVFGYALPPYTSRDNYVCSNVERLLNNVQGDLMDGEKLQKVVIDFDPEVVFHLAAQPLVRRSYKEAKYTFEVNIVGSINLFEACLFAKSVRAIVNVTSDKCYSTELGEEVFKEDDPLGGSDPYSASKAASEVVSRSYYKSFFQQKNVGLATARAGNVIGGGDWQEDQLVPDCIKALENHRTIEIRNPKAVRPWQHVLEPLSGYIRLAEKLYENPFDYSSGWNFGPEESSFRDVGYIVSLLVDKWGSGDWRHIRLEDQPSETSILKLDSQKAKEGLGWFPKWSLSDCIDRTIDWYQGSKDSGAYEICVKQIEHYLSD